VDSGLALEVGGVWIATQIPTRRLDLDDLGAKVRQDHAAIRPGDDLPELQDADVSERSHAAMKNKE